MANEKFNCQRGILISPDTKNGGAMVPLFLKTRSKDMYTNTKQTDIFTVEEYADRAVLRSKMKLSYYDFCDIHSGYTNGTMFHTIIFPYTFSNDNFFNVQILPQADKYLYTWARTTVMIYPLYTNTSKNTICGIQIGATAPTGFPETPNDHDIWYNIEVNGTIYENTNYIVNGYMIETNGKKKYAFVSPFNNDVFYFSRSDVAEITPHDWSALTISGWEEVWTQFQAGSKINLVFYYNEKNNKMLFKAVTP